MARRKDRIAVVLDTNVIVRALANPSGLSASARISSLHFNFSRQKWLSRLAGKASRKDKRFSWRPLRLGVRNPVKAGRVAKLK
jgi:hypothetical protein